MTIHTHLKIQDFATKSRIKLKKLISTVTPVKRTNIMAGDLNNAGRHYVFMFSLNLWDLTMQQANG